MKILQEIEKLGKHLQDQEQYLVYNEHLHEYFVAVYDADSKCFLEKDFFYPLEVTHCKQMKGWIV